MKVHKHPPVGPSVPREIPPRPRARRPFAPEIIGDPECPILHRWTLGGDRLMKNAPVKVLLHHFMPNTDDRDTHDHPRSFVTFVLWGSYENWILCPACLGREEGFCRFCLQAGLVLGDRMRPGMVRYRRATHAHRTRVGPRGCWTFVVMGPYRRRWGFWRQGRWWTFKDYQRVFGFGMRCGDEDR